MTDMSEQVTATSFEACIEALGHIERRRLLLSLLNDTSDGDRTVVLNQLGADAADETLRLSMYHSHLPKLEDLGFITVNSRQDSVTTGSNFAEIQPLVELLDNNRSQLPDGWV